MTKCKIVQKSDANKASLSLELPHSKKDHDNFLKNYKPTISTLNFNDFNPESDEYETISGLLLDYLEMIPKKQDIIEFEDFHFTITNVNRTTIQEVKLVVCQ